MGMLFVATFLCSLVLKKLNCVNSDSCKENNVLVCVSIYHLLSAKLIILLLLLYYRQHLIILMSLNMVSVEAFVCFGGVDGTWL